MVLSCQRRCNATIIFIPLLATSVDLLSIMLNNDILGSVHLSRLKASVSAESPAPAASVARYLQMPVAIQQPPKGMSQNVSKQ